MMPKEISVASRLQPLSVDDRKILAIAAWNFFSPLNHDDNAKILDLPPATGSMVPFSAYQFTTFLKRTGVMDAPIKLISQIRGLLDAMEREGLLTGMGMSQFVMAPNCYYSLKQLTNREAKGWAWLAPALGPEFLYSHFGLHTIHIIGDKDDSEHGGTGWAISDRHILTCAHVLTGMKLRQNQQIGNVVGTVKKTYTHTSIDVGIIELAEPCLPTNPAIGFRDPVIGEQLYVLGYPPVPMAREASLIMQGGEVVNQGITGYDGQEAFLYSAIARPGNSGGPIIAKSGQLLGIVTEDRFNQTHPHALFYAGIPTSIIARAISELGVDVTLPVETYK